MSLIRRYPTDPGIPLIGNTLEMAKDPGAFFLRMYRKHGPVYSVNVFGRRTLVLAGPEATLFLSSPEGRQVLSSKAFWKDFIEEIGANTIINGEDGERHLEMRKLLGQGFSKKALDGNYGLMFDIADRHFDAEWKPGTQPRPLPNMQYLITEQLGELLAGGSPKEYVQDIRLTTLFMLNVLVTKQRPKFFLLSPAYQAAKRRSLELADRMIEDLRVKSEAGELPDNLLGDIYRAFKEGSPYFKENDLPVAILGPYIAGLDTEANTLAAAIYGICKHPEIKAQVQAEADELFKKPTTDIEERDVRKLELINGCVKEALRLWTIAVAQLRSAAEDFTFEGHDVKKGQMMYVATSVPHYMQEFYEDPDTFNPWRMMKPQNQHLQKGSYAPFGRGPHVCLGQGIAEAQMALIIARLFHKRDLNLLHPDYKLKTKTAPTPGPTNGFKVRVEAVRN